MTLKNILQNKLFRDFCLKTAIYLPLSLAICFAVYFFTQRQITKADESYTPETVTFQKYTGNLDRHISIPLEQAGLSKEETGRIINKLDTVLDMRRLAPRDTYLLTLDENGGFKMLVVTKDFTRYYVAKNENDLLAGIMDITANTRTRFVKGTINDLLFTSMQGAGLKPSFILDFTDIFSWAVDFNTETRSGDKFAVLWQENYTPEGVAFNETVLAAYYDGLVGGKNYAIRFEDEFYDENGKFTKKMFLKAPISVRGARITSRFSLSRMHPVFRIRRPHLGIDYGAPMGTPVESVADGIVRFKGWKGGFGNYVEVSHPNSYVTCYGHLNSYARNVSVGVKVKQGQTIAFVGRTGVATGPHLDFRIRQGSKYFDFLKTKNRSSAVREIPANKRAEFNKIKEEYLKQLQENSNGPTPPASEEP
jgi:hypothetical protein